MSTKPTVKIIFRHSSSEISSEKEGFWTSFIQFARRKSQERNRQYDEDIFSVSEELFEGRVKNYFGTNLKKLLSQITSSDLRYDNEFKAQLSTAIIFTVESINYGSLDINLLIEPVEKVKKLFENNFDYFDAFLRAYALPALVESILSGGGRSYYSSEALLYDSHGSNLLPCLCF